MTNQRLQQRTRHRKVARGSVTILTVLLVLAAVTPGSTAEPAFPVTALDTIRRQDLARHINTLASDTLEGRAAGSDGGRAAGNYIVQQLRRLAVRPVASDGDFYQEFSDKGYRNILAVLPGSDPRLKNEFVLVGAHYDHVGLGTKTTSRGPLGQIHNGADDNASGTAALLEIAEALSTLHAPMRRSIAFVFWDAEELGLLGSKHWMTTPTIPLPAIRLVINVDMVGRLTQRRLIVFGTRTGTGLRGFASRHNAPMDDPLKLDFNWNLIANSDHHPFYERGIPVLMLHTGLHDDYHRPSDDADRLNLSGLSDITRLLFRMTFAAASRPQLPAFRGEAGSESEKLRKQRESNNAVAFDRLGISWDAELAKQGIVKLTDIVDDSAADEADLKKGDRLLEFGGWKIDRPDDLPLHVLAAPSRVEVLVDRRRRKGLRTVTLELPGQPIRFGFEWNQDPAEPGSVVVRGVYPGSPAATSGLRVGDRINRLDGKTVGDTPDFSARVMDRRTPITVRIERHGQFQSLRIIPLLSPIDADLGSRGNLPRAGTRDRRAR